MVITNIKPLRKVKQADKAVHQLQDNVAVSISALNASLIVPGNLLLGVKLTAGITNYVSHKLGRPYKTAFIGAPTVASAGVAFLTSTSPDLFLALTCTSNTTIDLWVI